MSLINNPYNQRDSQQEEPLVECDYCDTQLYEGYEAYRFDTGEVACSVECVLTVTGADSFTVGED